jgi:hypothetical protein
MHAPNQNQIPNAGRAFRVGTSARANLDGGTQNANARVQALTLRLVLTPDRTARKPWLAGVLCAQITGGHPSARKLVVDAINDMELLFDSNTMESFPTPKYLVGLMSPLVV